MNENDLIQFVGIQSQSFHELEAQSYRLLRILLGLGALAIAFTQTELFTNLLSLNIPEKELAVADGGASVNGFYRSFGYSHLIVSGGLGLITLLLIIDTAAWASKVLNTPPMQPTMDSTSDQPIGITIATDSIGRSNFAYWIQSNQWNLRLANTRLQNAYESLAASTLVLSITVLCAASVFLAVPKVLLAIDASLPVLGLGIISIYFRDVVASVYRGWTRDERTIRSELVHQFSRWENKNPVFPIAWLIATIYVFTTSIAVIFGALWVANFGI